VELRDNAGRREVRLKPLAEFAPLLNEPGKFLLIPAEEITGSWTGPKSGAAPAPTGPVHINVTNPRDLVPGITAADAVTVMQRTLEAVDAQRERTGQPMFAHLNHPNFRWGVTAEEMMRVERLRFFEVYNGHPGVENAGDATRLSMDAMWDAILAFRLSELKLGVVYGVATDDSHHYHKVGPGRSSSGRGWVMVRARHLSAESLIRALEAGDFYGSSGVNLREVVREPSRLALEVQAEPGVSYRIQFIGTRRGFDRRSDEIPAPANEQSARRTLNHRRYSPEVGAILAEEARAGDLRREAGHPRGRRRGEGDRELGGADVLERHGIVDRAEAQRERLEFGGSDRLAEGDAAPDPGERPERVESAWRRWRSRARGERADQVLPTGGDRSLEDGQGVGDVEQLTLGPAHGGVHPAEFLGEPTEEIWPLLAEPDAILPSLAKPVPVAGDPPREVPPPRTRVQEEDPHEPLVPRAPLRLELAQRRLEPTGLGRVVAELAAVDREHLAVGEPLVREHVAEHAFGAVVPPDEALGELMVAPRLVGAAGVQQVPREQVVGEQPQVRRRALAEERRDHRLDRGEAGPVIGREVDRKQREDRRTRRGPVAAHAALDHRQQEREQAERVGRDPVDLERSRRVTAGVGNFLPIDEKDPPVAPRPRDLELRGKRRGIDRREPPRRVKPAGRDIIELLHAGTDRPHG
jgi:hypothetical protein